MYNKSIVTPGIVFTVFLTIVVGCTSQAEKDTTSPHASKDLSGIWKTNLVDLRLTQSGNAVSGTYDYEGGKREGSITGNRLDYTWNQTNGKKGRGYFIISDDWNSVAGSYGYNDDDTNGGEWKGTKERHRQRSALEKRM